MTILHIAAVNRGALSGVSVVVPQHVKNQQRYTTVGLLNKNDYLVENIDNSFCGNVVFTKLPKPFNNPDLVVIHSIYDYGFDIIRLKKLLAKRRIPYIIICHGELTRIAQSKKRVKKSLANKLLFFSFIKRAAAIQCLSENEYENTIVKVPKILCTNGVSLPEIQKEYKERKQIKILYVGRLEVYIKGIDLLINAVKEKENFLREHFCSINIYGPDFNGRYSQVEKLINENALNDIVILHHEVIGNEKEVVLLDSDLFIQTSRTEGLPLGIIEAFSYGLPVIATKGTNMTDDILKWDAGWSADTTCSSIANALEAAINDKNSWAKKGNNARRIVIEKYIWENVAQKTLEKYKEIIDKSKRV